MAVAVLAYAQAHAAQAAGDKATPVSAGHEPAVNIRKMSYPVLFIHCVRHMAV